MVRHHDTNAVSFRAIQPHCIRTRRASQLWRITCHKERVASCHWLHSLHGEHFFLQLAPSSRSPGTPNNGSVLQERWMSLVFTVLVLQRGDYLAKRSADESATGRGRQSLPISAQAKRDCVLLIHLDVNSLARCGGREHGNDTMRAE